MYVYTLGCEYGFQRAEPPGCCRQNALQWNMLGESDHDCGGSSNIFATLDFRVSDLGVQIRKGEERD
jgi:hypothetical protein